MPSTCYALHNAISCLFEFQLGNSASAPLRPEIAQQHHAIQRVLQHVATHAVPCRVSDQRKLCQADSARVQTVLILSPQAKMACVSVVSLVCRWCVVGVSLLCHWCVIGESLLCDAG